MALEWRAGWVFLLSMPTVSLLFCWLYRLCLLTTCLVSQPCGGACHSNAGRPFGRVSLMLLSSSQFARSVMNSPSWWCAVISVSKSKPLPRHQALCKCGEGCRMHWECAAFAPREHVVSKADAGLGLHYGKGAPLAKCSSLDMVLRIPSLACLLHCPGPH